MQDTECTIYQVSKISGIPLEETKCMEYLITMLDADISIAEYFSLLMKIRKNPQYRKEHLESYTLPEDLIALILSVKDRAKTLNIQWIPHT
jgi:hypothetical protein